MRYVVIFISNIVWSMRINIKQSENEKLVKDEIILDLQYSCENNNIQNFIDYIYSYDENYQNKVIVLDDDYNFYEIEYKDIIMFYSNKKNNYCQTLEKSYKVKGKLYELENTNSGFIRISKSVIVNIRHIERFDISETGKIVVELDNKTEEVVSRRRTKAIMKYLEDRRI